MTALAVKAKHTRDYSRGKRPHQGELDRDDEGLTGTDYKTRLDPQFNKEYLLACVMERQRFYTSTKTANA